MIKSLNELLIHPLTGVREKPGNSSRQKMLLMVYLSEAIKSSLRLRRNVSVNDGSSPRIDTDATDFYGFNQRSSVASVSIRGDLPSFTEALHYDRAHTK
ncbi:MAG: hypothetical protein L0226_03905 [Acidobacteria bacterium]|nr:hypothetical protein [Acidobacteriota bacterium]